METVIRAEKLSKMYRIGKKHSGSLRETITGNLSKLFSKNENHVVEFQALNDVSFNVNQGEVVGIIGKNGAGKSTLLKILSRITEPSSGRAEIMGRVSSLLEVGTGFHPELTGRENIYMNGAILGMRRAEIKRKFDEIVAFSGIEQFIETPVKRYSSGMYVRLAFAVAAHLEPEILIVDEVLAVGDAEFQKKCLGKMRDVSEHDGRTVLFVSHNMEALQNLCSRALLLSDGNLIYDGASAAAIDSYMNHFLSSRTQQKWNEADAPGNEHVKLLQASVSKINGTGNDFTTMDDLRFDFEFLFLSEKPSQLDISYHLTDERGILVYVGSTAFKNQLCFSNEKIIATCFFPKNILNRGTYTIQRLLVVKDRGTVLYEHRDTLSFEILPVITGKLGWYGNKEGVIFLPQVDWILKSNPS